MVGAQVLGKKSLPSDSITLLNNQHVLDCAFETWWNYGKVRKDHFPLDSFLELKKIFWPSPRISAIKHLIKNDPQRPNVCFFSILLSLEYLWWHVERCTHYRLKHLFVIFCGLGESQVAYFDAEIVKEKIGGFYVSVDDIGFAEMVETWKNLLHLLGFTLKNLTASHWVRYSLFSM